MQYDPNDQFAAMQYNSIPLRDVKGPDWGVINLRSGLWVLAGLDSETASSLADKLNETVRRRESAEGGRVFSNRHLRK